MILLALLVGAVIGAGCVVIGVLTYRFALAPPSTKQQQGTWVVPVVAKDEDDANELVDEAKTTAERLGRWPSDADDEYVPGG